MKGIVEIYKNYGTPEEELIHQENNLIVDGAGEVICDLLTTPSGAVSSVTQLADSSNYTVQALSFGKASDAYKTNAHFYPYDARQYAGPGTEYYGYVDLVKHDHTLRAVSTSGQNIDNTVSSYDPLNDVGTTPNPFDKVLEPDTRTAIDFTVNQIHSMNDSLMQGRAPHYGHNLNRLVSNTNPNLISYTDNPHNGVWVSSTVKAGGSPLDALGLSGVTISGTNTGPFYGTSAFLVEGSGNTVTLRQDVSANRGWGERRYFHENLDNTFSTYIRLPDDLSLAPSSVTLTMKGDNMTAVLSHESKAVFNLSGGNDGLPAYLTNESATNGFGGVETLGIDPTSSHVGWQRIHVRVKGLMGATNGNKIRPIVQFNPSAVDVDGNFGEAHLYQYGWQLEEGFGPTKYQNVSGVKPSFNEGGLDGDLFLGCWPDTTGTKFAITSSIKGLDNTKPYQSTFMASAIYPMTPATDAFFNLSSVRCMDQNGFIEVHGSGFDGVTDATKGAVVSSLLGTGLSSIGEVAYTCTISSGDLGLANLYGGIFKCGLWTLDLKNTLQGNVGHYHNNKFSIIDKREYPAQPPLNFKAGNSNLVYKLFAEKSFTLNLCRIKDSGTAGSTAGYLDYDPLTLIWRIRFI